jgi:ComF family protein
VPVPLHASRLKERGFNQAVELARPISKRLKLKVRLDLCERSRATQVQSKLDSDERRKNLKDAFTVKAPVQGLHLALLDDVVTTGATAESLARTLREAGARRVTLWSVCRAASPYA